jgi:hypothetical protein
MEADSLGEIMACEDGVQYRRKREMVIDNNPECVKI